MKTLQDVLQELNHERVEQLAHLWGVAGGLPPLFWAASFLETTMQSDVCARFVWEHLSADERVVLYQILQMGAHVSGITKATIIKQLGISTTRCETALARLTSSLLILEEPTPIQEMNQTAQVQVTTPVLFAMQESASSLLETGRELFGQCDPPSRSLAEILRPLPWEWLSYTAQHHRLSQRGNRDEVEKLSQFLAEALASPFVILETLREIDLQLYHFCFWLYDQGGRAPMQEVRAYTGSDGYALLPLLRQLSLRALAFTTLTPLGEHLLFMPKQVYASLRRDLDKCASLFSSYSTPIASPPKQIQERGPLLLYDLVTLIGVTFQNDIELTKDGRVLKRQADKIRPLLHGQIRLNESGEDHYLQLLCQFALQQELLQVMPAPPRGAKPSLRKGNGLASITALSLLAQVKTILRWWTQTGIQIDSTAGKLVQKDPYTWEPAPARALLLSYLQKALPRTWHTIRSLLEQLWEDNPYSLRAGYYGPGFLGSRVPHRQHLLWDQCEARLFRGMLCSTLYELGIVALAWQEENDEEPWAFCVTELGAAVLSTLDEVTTESETLDETPSSPLIVLPTYEIHVLQTNLRVLFDLLPIAEVEQIDQTSRLRLTRNSVQRASDQGWSGEEIIDLLRRYMRSESTLPQPVTYSMRQWSAKNRC